MALLQRIYAGDDGDWPRSDTHMCNMCDKSVKVSAVKSSDDFHSTILITYFQSVRTSGLVQVCTTAFSLISCVYMLQRAHGYK